MRISLALLLLTLALPLGVSSPDTAPAGTAPADTAPAQTAPARTAPACPMPARTAPACTTSAPSVMVQAAMVGAGEPFASWVRSGRRFLSFDPRGDGQAVEVLGDLAAAERIAVLIPGVDTRLRDFDRGLGGVSRRAPAVQARAVYAALRAAAPGSRVAVVAWLGY